MLIDRGVVRVRPLKGGLEAWAAAGFDYERAGGEPVRDWREKERA